MQEDFIAAMRRLADEGRRRDSGCCAFGANGHEWRFRPPARMDEVHELETDLHITLPEPLVRYLTELGNGGCGPDYGIYSLAEMRRESDWLPDDISLPVFLTPTLTKKQWAAFVRGYNAIPYDDTYDDRAARYLEQMTAGTVAVSTPGCTMQTLLICRGEHAGEVVTVDFDIREKFPPVFCGSFAEWAVGRVSGAVMKLHG